ncbi:MAG: 8-amino-7-oxononanoate synthase, partial [Planctomycetota bacterium]
MKTELSNIWAEQLVDLADRGLLRRLREIESVEGAYVTIGGRRLCCFCSNNYLGLADHPQVIAAV